MQRIENNSNRLCGRLCIRVCGNLDAPMLIGSGEDEKSDYDVLLYPDGTPFLPGSALAGVMRAYLEQLPGPSHDGENNDLLFGGIQENWRMKKDEWVKNQRQSRLYVYDTIFQNASLILRDGVRLDEKRTASDQAKYNVQAVERGAGFTMRFEILVREQELNAISSGKAGDSEDKKLFNAFERDFDKIISCIAAMESGELRAGAKSRRGFGRLHISGLNIKAFYLVHKEEYKDWLDWDWDKKNAFLGSHSWNFKEKKLSAFLHSRCVQKEHCLQVPLRIVNTLLIRQVYAQGCETLQTAEKTSKAVIPGSAWAGTVRGHIASIIMNLCECKSWDDAQRHLEPFFGTWDPQGSNIRLIPSKAVFFEGVIKGGQKLPITRNSIDRFTGGTVNGALFQETVWAGGSTELVIHWPAGEHTLDWDAFLGLLLWAMKDIQNGLLTVGGEGGVGRGIFSENGKIILDGEPLGDQSMYLRAAAQWCLSMKRGEDTNGKC